MRYFIGIVIVCFLGSCASGGLGIFTKRKYTKGHYLSLVAHKKRVSQKEHQAIETLPLKKETVVLASTEPKTITRPLLQTSVVSPTLKYPNKIRSAIENSFSPILHKPHSYKRTSFKAKLQTYINKKDDSDKKAGFKFVVYVVLFFFLSFIYTLVIKARNPSIPWALCVIVAMFGSLLTLLTGQLFI